MGSAPTRRGPSESSLYDEMSGIGMGGCGVELETLLLGQVADLPFGVGGYMLRIDRVERG